MNVLLQLLFPSPPLPSTSPASPVQGALARRALSLQLAALVRLGVLPGKEAEAGAEEAPGCPSSGRPRNGPGSSSDATRARKATGGASGAAPRRALNGSCVLDEALEAALRGVWSDHGDALSTLYAGTGALKGDLTRGGSRTHRGRLRDGANAAARYILNHVADPRRQLGLDLLVGGFFDRAQPSAAAVAVGRASAQPVLRARAVGLGAGLRWLAHGAGPALLAAVAVAASSSAGKNGGA